MIFTEEKLTEIEQYASNFFSYLQVSTLVDIDFGTFLSEVKDTTSPVFRAYNRGKLICENDIRIEIINNAKMGSPAAQEQALKLIQKQELNDILNA